MRPAPPMPPRPHRAFFILVFTVFAVAFALPAGPVHAQGATGPAFGDSGWVAPLPAGSIDGSPEAPGPRVAEPEGEPVGETVLRTPFRILFYPFRLIARGLEGAAGVVLPSVAPRNDFGLGPEPSPISFVPTIEISGGPGLGLGGNLVYTFNRPHGGAAYVGGSYSLWDQRRLQAGLRWGRGSDPWRFDLRGRYKFRPNERFYGFGNFSERDDRAIWLNETGSVEATLSAGPPKWNGWLVAGWSSTSARRGWNGSPGVLDVFAPEEAPGMLDAASTLSYGAGGNLALVDDVINPTFGLHAIAEARNVNGLGGAGFDYPYTYLDGRAFLPVFGPRRVLSFRAAHQAIHPDEGEVVPFYLVPDVNGPFHLAAYSGHRFVDNHVAVLRGEYRWLVWEDKLWAFALAELGQVASSASRLRLADAHESYGGGLRLGFRDTVMRMTVAKGSEKLLIWFALEENY